MSTDTKNGDADFGRAAEAALARRAELGLTQEQIFERLQQAETGIALDTYRRFERNSHTSYRRTTLAAISRALDWPPSMLYDIARGSSPGALDRLDALTAEVARIAVIVDGLETFVAGLPPRRSRSRRA